MPLKTITGTLTIPNTEPSASGVYTDLKLELYFLTGGTESLQATASTYTTNVYEFTYEDEGQDVLVKLVRKSNSYILSQSNSRGVLPRSFLAEVDDPITSTFSTSNWLFDAGLSIVAATAGRWFSLAKEMTKGVELSQITSGGTIPFSANHVNPQLDADFSANTTGTVAMVAYSLGYYLENNSVATNITSVADTYYDLISFLLQQRNVLNYDGLYLAGTGSSIAKTTDNILVYFALKQAGRILNSSLYSLSTSLANTIMQNLYNESTQRFYYSDNGGGYSIQDNLELNVFGALFLIEEGQTTKAESLLNHIKANYSAIDTSTGVNAFKAKTSDFKLWFEGSYATAIIQHKLGLIEDYTILKRSLNSVLNEDGSYKLGTIKDGFLNVTDYKSVGSTAWGYMANRVPDKAFSISEGSPLIGLPARFFNAELSSGFTKNDCSVGTTGTTMTYTVPLGRYSSLTSQVDADTQAAADMVAYGQLYANQFGVCQVPYVYFNTDRTGFFQKDCNSSGLGYAGSIHEYTIPANSFGSIISQEHAEALADAKLIIDGQLNANTIGSCTLTIQEVWIQPVKTVVNNGDYDDIYISYSADAILNTGVTISGRFKLEDIYAYQATPLHFMSQGTQTTSPTFLGSVVAGSSSSLIQATGLTPTNYGYQQYITIPSIDLYGNELQSAYFIKSCAGNNISASSILEYIIPVDTYTSKLNQSLANAKAWKDITLNGQTWVDNNPAASCSALFGNDYQASAFTSNTCALPYTGVPYTYVVLPNTYQALTLSGANALAMADIALNGQNTANAIGVCALPPNYRKIQIRPKVDYFGLYDNVYGIPRIVGFGIANTDITIAYDLFNDATGVMTYSAGTVTLFNGDNYSPEQFLIQVPSHQGDRIRPIITSLTPSSHGGITYFF